MYDNVHIPWDISDERRQQYARSSKASQAARKDANALAEKKPEELTFSDLRPKFRHAATA